jgi:hypothetical protein
MEVDSHKFLRRKKVRPRAAEVNELVASILNHYTHQDITPSKYAKMEIINLRVKGQAASTLCQVRFEDIALYLQENRSFHHDKFGLPPLRSDWLDAVPVFSLNAPIHAIDVNGPLKFLSVPFGESFPVKPCLDREGVAFGTFQVALQENIVRLYNRIIDESHLAVEVDQPVWFHDLRMLINDCVTIVDITLHQLICKAQYDPKPGWKFDSSWIKRRTRTGVMEKFEWIKKIIGQGLDNAEEEKTHFGFLKNIRNHFNHFYPPCVVFTLEDTCEWLNRIPAVGRLLWKMREKMDEPVNTGIVEIVTLPLCEFVPRKPDLARTPQGNNVGYRSSLWTTQEASAQQRSFNRNKSS